MTHLTDMLEEFKKNDCLTPLAYAGARAHDLVKLNVSLKAYDGGGTIVFTQKGDELEDGDVHALLEREVPYLVMFVSKPWLKAYVRTYDGGGTIVFTQKGDELEDGDVHALLEREVPYLVMFVSKPWLKAYVRTRYASEPSVYRWDVVGGDGDIKDEAVQRAAAVTLPGLLYAAFGYSPQYYETNGYQI